jgi:uncharacterized membrane protein
MFDFPASRLKQISIVLNALFYTAIGIRHFMATEQFAGIMPDWLPAHSELVLISGFFEIAGGLGLLFGATRQYAGWGLLALLVCVFPANVNMALNPEPFIAQGMTLFALYFRLPWQFVFMAWVWWLSKPDAVAVEEVSEIATA